MTPRTPPDAPSPASIRRRRVSLGLTAHDLADMAGIGEAEVLLLERGTLPSITKDAWACICSALKLTAANGYSLPAPVATGQQARRGRNQGTSLPLPTLTPSPAPSAPWWVQLRLQRRRMGMSVSEVAKHARIDARRVMCLENGSHPATSEHMEYYYQLATHLAIDPPELPVLPAVAVAWEGFSVGSRAERGYQVATRLAVSSLSTTPAGSLMLARLQNGWSRSRTARAIGIEGTHGATTIEAEEVRRAWPLRSTPAFARLAELWRVPTPYRLASEGEGERQRARATAASIVERAEATAGAWGLSSEDVCILCDLSPIHLDSFLTRNLARPHMFWSATAALTAHGFNLLAGLVVTAGARASSGGEKVSAADFPK